ncbi:MAG: CO dehydrogenase/CO-methylating acetyl-CoA synthase complex subunit beta [Halobacteriota archaeon]
MNKEAEQARERQRIWDSLPKGTVYLAPADPDDFFKGINYDISPRQFGLRVRKHDMYCELGGPKHRYCSFFFIEVINDIAEIEDGRVEVIGPEIKEIEGKSFPFGFWVRYAGEHLTEDYLDLLTRWTYFALEEGEGWMLLNTRDTIWLRLHKKAAHKHDFKHLGQAMINLCKIQFPLVEKADVKILIATEELGGAEFTKGIVDKVCLPYWVQLDERARRFSDEDVDTFYGCTICQTFAPSHVCVVAPDRPPYCGIITWIGAKVMCDLDPYGYIFEMPLGKCVDPWGGEYTGVNEKIYEKSNRSYKRVVMYSSITYPQTNCGCFEAAIFYIPEVDGLGLVDRRYSGDTPLGLTFSKLAGLISGGLQNHGYCGISFRTPRSNKFVRADGGWRRIVWIPKEYKQMLAEVIPPEMYDKIATEDDCTDPLELKEFLMRVNHPVTALWKNRAEPEPIRIPPPNTDWTSEDEIKARERGKKLLEA